MWYRNYIFIRRPHSPSNKMAPFVVFVKQKCSDPDCGLFGATLGCRVRSCKKNYHYPCADRLSVYLKVRMWDGLKLPIACKEHRHIKSICDIKSKRKRKRVAKGLFCMPTCIHFGFQVDFLQPVRIIEYSDVTNFVNVCCISRWSKR